MDIRTFCKRFMIWTAIVVAAIIVTLGLLFGKVVEATLAEEIGKWVVMGIFIVGIFEVFAYILAPFFYHMIYDKRK
jgi:undecaprenyl pyrophosphate phosphatase UppP